jgi:hypothetical protein
MPFPKRRVLCDCDFSSFTVSSPGSVLHGVRWLLWRHHKQVPAVHSKCRIRKRVNKERRHNRSVTFAMQVSDATPFIHTFRNVVFSNLQNTWRWENYKTPVILCYAPSLEPFKNHPEQYLVSGSSKDRRSYILGFWTFVQYTIKCGNITFHTCWNLLI